MSGRRFLILPGKVYIPLICKARQQGEGMNGFTETTEKRPLTGRKYRIRSVAAAAGCCLLLSLTACGGVAPLTSYERGTSMEARLRAIQLPLVDMGWANNTAARE